MRFYNAKRTRFVDIDVGDGVGVAELRRTAESSLPSKHDVDAAIMICSTCEEYRPDDLVICRQYAGSACRCAGGLGSIALYTRGCPLHKWPMPTRGGA